MRRFLAIGCLLGLSLALFWGCGGSATDPLPAPPGPRTPSEKPVRIAVVGHTYKLLSFENVWQDFLDTIRATQPDYVFHLGDIVFDNTDAEWAQALSGLKSIGVPVGISPGNHDHSFHYDRFNNITARTPLARWRFLTHVGYYNHYFTDDRANYVFLNSHDSVANICAYLDSIVPQLDSSKKALLFTHHFIWGGKPNPKSPYAWAKKTYLWEEVRPCVRWADAIVVGDWNQKPGIWRQEWYKAITVGNRLDGDPVYVCVIEISDRGVDFELHEVPVPDSDPWHYRRINKLREFDR